MLVHNFRDFFLSFTAQRDGFLVGCRPFIGLNGCYLMRANKRVLLTTTALDIGSSLFPEIFSVVNVENHDSWCWFLSMLGNRIQQLQCMPLCFMLDR